MKQNSRFNSYFEGNEYLDDPEGCLDFIVLKAMNTLQDYNTIYIVVIDALDECIEYGNRNIFNLLWKRLHVFPKNKKFSLRQEIHLK